jgi:hypothetical protein
MPASEQRDEADQRPRPDGWAMLVGERRYRKSCLIANSVSRSRARVIPDGDQRTDNDRLGNMMPIRIKLHGDALQI